MMIKRDGLQVSERRRAGGWGTNLAALLFVVAQLLALGHSHSTSGLARFSAQAQAVAAEEICGLCVLVFHAPVGLAARPTLERPRPASAAVLRAETRTFASGAHSFFLTRAPPFTA